MSEDLRTVRIRLARYELTAASLAWIRDQIEGIEHDEKLDEALYLAAVTLVEAVQSSHDDQMEIVLQMMRRPFGSL